MEAIDKTRCTYSLSDEADIVVVGSCMVELLAYVVALPKVDEAINGFTVRQRYSGKGANQCVAASKLGASVALISKLGDDKFGKSYLDELRKYPSINTKYIWLLKDVPTGYYSTTVAMNDARHSITVPGANEYLSMSDIDHARNVLLNARVVLFQGETPWETTLYCLQKLLVSLGSRAKIIVNPSPAIYPLNPIVMILADYLCLNEAEAEVITDMKISNENDLTICMEKLLSMKCNVVIITLGENGVVYASKDSQRVKTVKVDPVTEPAEVDGVGDCFVGALAYFVCYYPKLPLREIILKSCQVARLSLFSIGLQSSYPDKNFIDEKLLLP